MNLKPCPFCGGTVNLGVTDDEGNNRRLDYENDPYSGLWFVLKHFRDTNPTCPIATFNDQEGDGLLGTKLYESRKEAAQAWNSRVDYPSRPEAKVSTFKHIYGEGGEE